MGGGSPPTGSRGKTHKNVGHIGVLLPSWGPLRGPPATRRGGTFPLSSPQKSRCDFWVWGGRENAHKHLDFLNSLNVLADFYSECLRSEVGAVTDSQHRSGDTPAEVGAGIYGICAHKSRIGPPRTSRNAPPRRGLGALLTVTFVVFELRDHARPQQFIDHLCGSRVAHLQRCVHILVRKRHGQPLKQVLCAL